jgi:hypothetical protein
VKKGRSSASRVSELVLDAYGCPPSATFDEFMSMRTETLSADDFVEMYERVAHRPEPIIRYAAGWMLVEAAIIRHRRLDEPSGNTCVLDRARQVWTDVLTETDALIADDGGDRQEQEGLLQLNWRIAMYICFLPAFEAIGNSLDTGTLPPQEHLDDTHEALLAFTQDLLDCVRDSARLPDYAQNYYRGLGSELLVALLMHRANRPDVVVVPASLKYENFQNRSLRVDLFAYDYRGDDEVKKTPVQVKASTAGKHAIRTDTVLIYGSDIVLDGRDGSLRGRTAALTDTLTAIVAEYHGSAGVHESARIRRRSLELDAAAKHISDKITAFRFRRFAHLGAQPHRNRDLRLPRPD